MDNKKSFPVTKDARGMISRLRSIGLFVYWLARNTYPLTLAERSLLSSHNPFKWILQSSFNSADRVAFNPPPKGTGKPEILNPAPFIFLLFLKHLPGLGFFFSKIYFLPSHKKKKMPIRVS